MRLLTRLGLAAAGVLLSISSVRGEVIVTTPLGTVRVGQTGVLVATPRVTVRVDRLPAPVLPPPTFLPSPVPLRPGEPPAVPIEELPQPIIPAPRLATQPVPAPVPTVEEFATVFKPCCGKHHVVIQHPFTCAPVKLCLSLPQGRPRKVRFCRRFLEFDYGTHCVVVRFFRDGTVQVVG